MTPINPACTMIQSLTSLRGTSIVTSDGGATFVQVRYVGIRLAPYVLADFAPFSTHCDGGSHSVREHGALALRKLVGSSTEEACVIMLSTGNCMYIVDCQGEIPK